MGQLVENNASLQSQEEQFIRAHPHAILWELGHYYTSTSHSLTQMQRWKIGFEKGWHLHKRDHQTKSFSTWKQIGVEWERVAHVEAISFNTLGTLTIHVDMNIELTKNNAALLNQPLYPPPTYKLLEFKITKLQTKLLWKQQRCLPLLLLSRIELDLCPCGCLLIHCPLVGRSGVGWVLGFFCSCILVRGLYTFRSGPYITCMHAYIHMLNPQIVYCPEYLPE